MIVKADAQVHIIVSGLSFTAEDTFTTKGLDGKHSEVLVDTVSVTMYRLNDDRPSQYWAKGLRVREDGSVGRRRASQVLLQASQIPLEVLAAIREAYITQIRHLSTEDGMQAAVSH